MPIDGNESAKSMNHASGEGSQADRTGKDPKGEGKPSFKGPSKSRYNAATHTMKKSSGSSGGYANKASTVRPLTAQEHRQAAQALHAQGQPHAASHHIAAAEAMEGDSAPVSAGGAPPKIASSGRPSPAQGPRGQ